METIQIINWLYDKAARAQDHSYARMLNLTAKRMRELEEKQRWIPVTERLPEINADGTANAVIVTNGAVQHMAYFAHGIWHFTENGEMKEPMFYDVTNWMPLPEPPKEVE